MKKILILAALLACMVAADSTASTSDVFRVPHKITSKTLKNLRIWLKAQNYSPPKKSFFVRVLRKGITVVNKLVNAVTIDSNTLNIYAAGSDGLSAALAQQVNSRNL
ncbi:hypothetical protein HOL34_02390 [bacterium]|nr:hypothetical protein [bacterium]MBT3903310.1 hypothetical protein [bacterium]MBT4577558.1 hypothetical protein [bacterium]MBT5345668.1 hypothetical protein [bacterium]MBT6130941.1 hypothetical protein [bacterium]